jgi:hypothetical protein
MMYSVTRDKAQILFKLILLSVLTLFVLIGCGSGDNPTSSYATWTPSPLPTATCNPNMSLSTPSEWGKTQLVVILYDPRPETVGDQFLELEDKGKVENVSSFVDKIVPHLIKPGGQVAIFQLGYSTYDGASVARLYSYSAIPQLYNTPSLPQTLTPLPSPIVTLTPGFGFIATEQANKKLLAERSAVETEMASEYNCGISYWNTVVQSTATAWNGTATAEISDAEVSFATEVASHDTDAVETPFKTDELYYGGVYYGLSFVSTIFQSDCKNYSKCSLIIIDDLRVYREHNSDNLPINLAGVNVYAVMPNCRDLNQPKCMKQREYWDNEFAEYGAVQPVYFNGIRAEKNLKDVFRR